MRPRTLKRLFRFYGAACLFAGVAFALAGFWTAFSRRGRDGITLAADLAAGAICLALAALLMRFGRDIIGYYRVK